MKPFPWALLIVGLTASFGANYLLALAGEPRAYWLMHTVFGMI